ncbi:Uncharacterised protein [uncultured archaeon]|nr:Uncharacterised protein [uncultured archaeon]
MALKARRIAGKIPEKELEKLDVLLMSYDHSERLFRYFSLGDDEAFLELHSCTGKRWRLIKDGYRPLTENIYSMKNKQMLEIWRDYSKMISAEKNGSWFSDMAKSLGIDTCIVSEMLHKASNLKKGPKYEIVEAVCKKFSESIINDYDAASAYLPLLRENDVWTSGFSLFELNYCLISYNGTRLGKKEVSAVLSLFETQGKK